MYVGLTLTCPYHQTYIESQVSPEKEQNVLILYYIIKQNVSINSKSNSTVVLLMHTQRPPYKAFFLSQILSITLTTLNYPFIYIPY